MSVCDAGLTNFHRVEELGLVCRCILNQMYADVAAGEGVLTIIFGWAFELVALFGER